jgi:CDP-diacylglycerol--serine O-phosphatidyltransferase
LFHIKKNIPNIITCGNLLCGCLAIVKAFEGDLVWAAYLVGIAAVLDFLDGFMARILKVHSEIGKQLDSMADMVTFGIVPGVVMFFLLSNSVHYIGFSASGMQSYIPYLGFLISIFSGVRLAKFNIDVRQSDSFIGVPTPANAMLICSFGLIVGNERLFPIESFTGWISELIHQPWFLIIITLVMSFLLVAEIPLFALKFKNFGWNDNKIRYIFLTCCLIMLVFFKFAGIPIIILLYILFSVIQNMVKKVSTD